MFWFLLKLPNTFVIVLLFGVCHEDTKKFIIKTDKQAEYLPLHDTHAHADRLKALSVTRGNICVTVVVTVIVRLQAASIFF